MVAQYSECTNATEWFTLKWLTIGYENFTQNFFKKEGREKHLVCGGELVSGTLRVFQYFNIPTVGLPR